MWRDRCSHISWLGEFRMGDVEKLVLVQGGKTLLQSDVSFALFLAAFLLFEMLVFAPS